MNALDFKKSIIYIFIGLELLRKKNIKLVMPSSIKLENSNRWHLFVLPNNDTKKRREPGTREMKMPDKQTGMPILMIYYFSSLHVSPLDNRVRQKSCSNHHDHKVKEEQYYY
jgi:hypothetical protein